MAGINLPSRRLVSQEDAAVVQRSNVPRSRFAGSWSHKSTYNAGVLYPFLVDEILPGDHMKYDVTAFIRMATAVFPMMDSQRIDTHFFFVPCRLLWDNWQRFMGEQDSPTDSISFTIPVVVSPAGGFADHSLYDHMGLPTDLDPAGTIAVNALPFRAYHLIVHEWFRDQNVMTSLKPNVGDGPDLHGLYLLRQRAKSADYFTSALPWPQKFNAPTLAIGGQAPIQGIAFSDGGTPNAGSPGGTWQETAGGSTASWLGYYTGNSASIAFKPVVGTMGADPAIYADLSGASGTSIEVFRQAFLVQQLLEQQARGGTRYTEIIKGLFGVTSPDFRLQRPEYIGGGSSPLHLTPIAQTAPTTGVPLGALGAAGSSVGSHRASFAATEHGYVIGIISVKTELSYQQKLDRMWTRETNFDFYVPPLAGLSEQAIYRREIYPRGTADDDLVFGYQERWHEYRTRVSEVTGQFRSQATGTLDAWHLAQNFTAAPTLNPAFLYDTPPMARVLAAGASAADQQYLADILIRRDATRPLPMYGTPVTLGRF